MSEPTRRREFRVFPDRTEFATIEEPPRSGEELWRLMSYLSAATQHEGLQFDAIDCTVDPPVRLVRGEEN